MSPVQDGPSCPGCGLPNYYGLCGVCRGNEELARAEGLPYPFEDDPDPVSVTGHRRSCQRLRDKARRVGKPMPACECLE